jgi:hypothetical protein
VRRIILISAEGAEIKEAAINPFCFYATSGSGKTDWLEGNSLRLVVIKQKVESS